MVSFVNVMNNGLLRASLPPGPERTKHGITAYNHPLNLTKEQLTEMAMLLMLFICAVCITSRGHEVHCLSCISEENTKNTEVFKA